MDRGIHRRLRNEADKSSDNLIDLSEDNGDSTHASILGLFDPIHSKIPNEESNSDLPLNTQLVQSIIKQPNDINKKRNVRGIVQKHIATKSDNIITSNQTKSEILQEKDNQIAGNSHPTIIKSQQLHYDLNDALNHDINFSMVHHNGSDKLKLIRKTQRSSRELILLTERIKSFRSNFKFDDPKTNPGIIYSPRLYSPKIKEMSVKVIITSPMAPLPINFTCSASTSVQHLISHAIYSMFDHLDQEDNMDNYILKVTGKDEYIDSDLTLADYGLVSHCCKFDADVKLTLLKRANIKKPFLRISQDDYSCAKMLSPDDLMWSSSIIRQQEFNLNYESLHIIIQAFDREADRLYNEVSSRSSNIQTQSLLQTTKAICSSMMSCETSQLTESKNNLIELCRSYKNEGSNLQDEDHYKMIEVIQNAIRKLMLDMHHLLRVFSNHLPVDYEVVDMLPNTRKSLTFVDSPVGMIKDQVSLHIQSISQLCPDWISKYQDFHLRLGLMYGETILCPDVATNAVRIETSLFPRLHFDQLLVLSIPYCELPREARFVLTLYGSQSSTGNYVSQANNLTIGINNGNLTDDLRPLRRAFSSTSISSTTPVYSSSPRSGNQLISGHHHSSSEPIQTPLAQSLTYLFDVENILRRGDGLLPFHLIDSEYPNNPIYIECTPNQKQPIALIEYKVFPPEKKIFFPDVDTIQTQKLSEEISVDELNSGVKFIIDQTISKKQPLEPLMDDEKHVLWDNRYYLTKIPEALPKILKSVPKWSLSQLVEIYHLLEIWSPLEPVDALEMLLPSLPDARVRKKAVQWLSQQNDDDLCDYLPQLLQTFRYERGLDCPLFWLILGRSMKNPRIANIAYWQLKMNNLDNVLSERSEILINCLLWLSGSTFWKAIDKQKKLLSMLNDLSTKIKGARDSHRNQILIKELERVQDYLVENKSTMPWSPSLEICDLDLNSCSYFPSNTLPLKLCFRSCDISCNRAVKFYNFEAIFKAGDDLRQDMLAIHLIRIMEKLWLREGLDLKMITFDCIATGHRQGMVEMVQNAETLRKIHQNSSFLTGPFNPQAIDNYIRLWNTSELEYKTAVDKFLHSCAGYSVATYILGICDRHNDNIMVTNLGHLFHIDFGKFLGDAQMLGNIKRDRTPFVLTSDMAYVINGGDRPSKRFQTFIELCTLAFNIVRRHKNIFINLISMMTSAQIHNLNPESIGYIERMLMPQLTEIEAMAKFTRLIEDCLSSRSTQVNFFIHNLAQLKFSSDNTKQSLLSFVPKTFTIRTDSRITWIKITGVSKRFDPEKQYYYELSIRRENQPELTSVFRTFNEFCELQLKLSSMFPDYKFHDINKTTGGSLMDFVVRKNTREVAYRRLVELRIFLDKLMKTAHIKSHDLIYTFFHPILRDEQWSKASNRGSGDVSFDDCGSGSSSMPQEYSQAQRHALYLDSNGQVKLSLIYKNNTLMIMVMHAKNLACPDGINGPNSYAKTYLLPDPTKQTKRRTRVIRQSRHPSYMELIVYQAPLESLRKKMLQVSIWHSELVHNKAFLGAALIGLDKLEVDQEERSWHPLRDLK